MQKIKLENVSFNKLKEFTSLGSKKNTTIKGKFTLIGEYELITKDGGDSMTLKRLSSTVEKLSNTVEKLSNTVDDLTKIVLKNQQRNEEMFKLIMGRLDKLENLVMTEFKKHGWIKK